MLSPDFIQALCCLHTGGQLRLSSDQQRDRINRAIEAGRMMNVVGETIDEAIEHALVDNGLRFAYPIRQGIPTLIRDEAFAIDGAMREELRKEDPDDREDDIQKDH